MTKISYNYGTAMLAGFEYLLGKYPEVFVIGQGLWSPWYVGNSMTDLDKKFGAHRVIDTPVSESACTGAAVGAALAGMKPIIVHPRMDFMLYAMDAIINQAAKWSHMVGGQASPGLTIRAIINRGGEQGAQHSQALHSWFAHVPGLRVVMPASVADARDLLISSVLSPDPVIFIDDRWLYDLEDELPDVIERPLSLEGPRCVEKGIDVTLVALSYSTKLVLEASKILQQQGIFPEIIDLRVINPLDPAIIIDSVKKTGRIMVVDGGWSPCGIAGEVIATVIEKISPKILKASPCRITLPFAPAPTASVLEKIYYPTVEMVVFKIKQLVKELC
jgi:acetoin:2,6-dichlorophenolindophenol oxidoreductase subunit beta